MATAVTQTWRTVGRLPLAKTAKRGQQRSPGCQPKARQAFQRTFGLFVGRSQSRWFADSAASPVLLVGIALLAWRGDARVKVAGPSDWGSDGSEPAILS